MKNTNYSVKNRHSYGIMLLALLLCGRVSAKVTNFIGASANVGEWSMLPSGSKYTGSLGVAGGVGFVYELRAGETYGTTQFLFDVGVGAWYDEFHAVSGFVCYFERPRGFAGREIRLCV